MIAGFRSCSDDIRNKIWFTDLKEWLVVIPVHFSQPWPLPINDVITKTSAINK